MTSPRKAGNADELVRRVPKQRRSREIVSAILEASRQLLGEAGSNALTTNRIAERAGISIGSLYRYFPDKAAIVAALIEADTGREASALEDAPWPIERASLAEGLAQLVDFQLDRHRRLIDHGGELYRSHLPVSSLHERLGRSVEARIREMLAKRHAETRIIDIDQAAFLLTRGVSAIVRLTALERPEKLGDPAFRQELIDLVVRYAADADGTLQADRSRS